MPKTLPLEYIETETIAADGKRVITRAKMPKEEETITGALLTVATTACVLYCGYRLVKAFTSDSVPDAALIGGDPISL